MKIDELKQVIVVGKLSALVEHQDLLFSPPQALIRKSLDLRCSVSARIAQTIASKLFRGRTGGQIMAAVLRKTARLLLALSGLNPLELVEVSVCETTTQMLFVF